MTTMIKGKQGENCQSPFVARKKKEWTEEMWKLKNERVCGRVVSRPAYDPNRRIVEAGKERTSARPI